MSHAVAKELAPNPEIREVRSAGRLLLDKALFEVDMTNGDILWANEFACERYGYRPDQITTLSIFALAPNGFQDQVQDSLAEPKSGKGPKYSIWPGKTTSGRIVWWYVYQMKVVGNIQWVWAEHIQDTEAGGTGFAFMKMQMDLLRNQVQAGTKLDDLEEWATEEFEKVVGALDEIKKDMGSVIETSTAAERSATSAANTSLALQSEVKVYFKRFEDSQSEHTAEILKLIGTDTLVDKRMEAFEKHVQSTTDIAIKSISTATDKAGKGLSKRVTIPVSAIAAAAAIVQWLIQNWDKVKGFFH